MYITNRGSTSNALPLRMHVLRKQIYVFGNRL